MSDEVEVQSGAARLEQLAIARASTTGPKTLKAARHKGNEIVRQANLLEHLEVRKCRATAVLRGPDKQPVLDAEGKRQRRPCRNNALPGGFVCAFHGGNTPHVKKKAAKRLLAMVEPGLVRLNELMHQNEHLPTALGAIKTVLERAGTKSSIGTLAKDEGGDSRPIIQIGIAVGGINQPKPEIAVNLIPGRRLSDVAEGEVADEGNDGGS